MVLIIAGMPVALVLSWMFEITPEGVKRTEDVDRTKPHSIGGAWIYVVVAAATISIGLFFLGRYTAGNVTTQSREISTNSQKSIAVLPLLNESGDPKDEYFSDGLSEELIAELAQISGLKVIGRSSSFRFKDRKEEPKSIGEKLGVSTLLEGTVRKQGDRVRIVAALVSARDGVTLWTHTFDRELKDIFAVQQEIARAVAQSLQVTLLGTENSSSQMATTSVEAHNAYLQGHSISAAVTSRIFAKRSLTSIRPSSWIRTMPRFTLNVPKRGRCLVTSAASAQPPTQRHVAMRTRP